MKLIKHDKEYDEELNIKEITVSLNLDTNNEIDNIIYYLICAQQKLNEGEQISFEARIESAYEKLKKYIKGL